MAPSVARSWPEAVLDRLDLFYGITLLTIFVISIALNSILDVRRAAQLIRPAATGPGGRPLPATRRKSQDSATVTFTPDLEISNTTKRVYIYATVLLVLTFVANFASVISHTVYETKNPEIKFGWWCGEETSVCYFVYLYSLLLPAAARYAGPASVPCGCGRRA